MGVTLNPSKRGEGVQQWGRCRAALCALCNGRIASTPSAPPPLLPHGVLALLGAASRVAGAAGKRSYALEPLDLGIPRCTVADLAGGDAQLNARILMVRRWVSGGDGGGGGGGGVLLVWWGIP